MRSSLADAVRREYARLAPAYDARWERYVRESARFALDALPLRPGDRLLDVGCGTGHLLARALERGPRIRVVGVDLSREMLAAARERLGSGVPLVEGAAEWLPFPDAAFDAVVTTSSLHYWSDPERGIREAGRVLRAGGTLVVADWSADRLSMRILGRVLRILRRPLGTIYGTRDLAALLRPGGLVPLHSEHRRIGWPWTIQRVVATRPASSSA